MSLPKAIKKKLEEGFFPKAEHIPWSSGDTMPVWSVSNSRAMQLVDDGCYSFVIGDTGLINNSNFYTGKSSLYGGWFNFNWDLADPQYRGHTTHIHYATRSLASILTTDELNTLNTYMGSNYHWEIRIITHNHKATRRRGSRDSIPTVTYPKWQNHNNYSRWDLNDINSLVGVSGTEADEYSTNITRWRQNTNNAASADYDLYRRTITNLNGGWTWPASSTYHRKTHGSFTYGWGYPAIINGYGSLVYSDFGQINKINWTTSSSGYTNTFPKTINLNFLNTSNGNDRPEGWTFTEERQGVSSYPALHNKLQPFTFKVLLNQNTIKTTNTYGDFEFPIVEYAMHTLLNRTGSLGFTNGVPDCFDYCVALVIYKHTTDTSFPWKIEDIICDSLRTIDRWDMNSWYDDDRYYDFVDWELQKHPIINFYYASAGWQQDGLSQTATFYNIDATWVNAKNLWENKPAADTYAAITYPRDSCIVWCDNSGNSYRIMLSEPRLVCKWTLNTSTGKYNLTFKETVPKYSYSQYYKPLLMLAL